MGLNLCGTGVWNRVGAMVSGASGIPRTQTVTVKGKVKCPCGCNHEFEAEMTVEQKVIGGVTDFTVKPVAGISDLCMWK